MNGSYPTFEERFAAWLPAGRLEGEETWIARMRFRTIELRSSLKAIRIVHGIPEPTPPAPPPEPLVDDGMDDLVWARRNPDRRYRVRPHRAEDGPAQVRPGHCMTVVDVVTKHGAWGVSIDAMHSVGVPAKVEDTDAYAVRFLQTRAASNGFRKPCPELAG